MDMLRLQEILEAHVDAKTGVALSIVERRNPAAPRLARQFVCIDWNGRHAEVECRDRRAARLRLSQMIADLEDDGRSHPTLAEFRVQSLEDLATKRVEHDPDLRLYADKILYGWGREDNANWEWVLATPKVELLAWARTESYRDDPEPNNEEI